MLVAREASDVRDKSSNTAPPRVLVKFRPVGKNTNCCLPSRLASVARKQTQFPMLCLGSSKAHTRCAEP